MKYSQVGASSLTEITALIDSCELAVHDGTQTSPDVARKAANFLIVNLTVGDDIKENLSQDFVSFDDRITFSKWSEIPHSGRGALGSRFQSAFVFYNKAASFLL